MEMSSRRTMWQAGGLLLVGAIAGGVLATQMTASAASGSNPATPSAYTAGPMAGDPRAGGPGAPGEPGGPGGPGGRGFGLPLSGTVTAVGTNSVTIKTTGGTTTYAVDAQSDIDKNGEAQLSDLKVGDAVRFAVRPNTSTVAVLHAGSEAKDRPAMGGRHHGPCPNMGGARPTPTASPSSTT